MDLHNNLKYADIVEVNKIIIQEDMLKQIEQYFLLNFVPNYIDYSFKSLNIEILSDKKLNIFIENTTKNNATITVFCKEKKVISFVIEYIFDIFFEVHEILEYEEISKYRENAEELILFVLRWFPIILYYIMSHIGGYDNQLKKYTFFVNTKNFRLNT